MKKKAKLFLKIAVSAFFVYLIVIKINWAESLVYLRQIKSINIVCYFLVIFSGMGISAYKWKFLANYKNFQRPFVDFFKLYITGAFINNFVPSTIGGDVFRAYQLGKGDKRYSEATSTVVVDRLTGLLALVAMTPIFSLLNFEVISENRFLLLINGIILAALLGFVFFLLVRKKNWSKKIVSWAPEKIKNFLGEVNSFGDDRGIFLKALFYSVLFNLFGVALANLILFWSLGVNLNVISYLSVIFVISIISSIPAGVGLKEWSYVTLFGLLGVDPAAVIIVAILNRFLQGLVNIGAFPIYLQNK